VLARLGVCVINDCIRPSASPAGMTRYSPVADRLPAAQPDYPGLARERSKRRAARVPTTTPPATQRPYGTRRDNRYTAMSAALASPNGTQAAISAATQAASVASAGRSIPARSRTADRTVRMAPDDEAVASLPISLKDEFARVRKGQAKGQDNGRAGQPIAPSRPRRISVQRPKRPVLTAILSVFAIALLVGGVTLGPLVYRGFTAYRDIFEEQVPHDDSPFVVAVNPEGTAQIVPENSTADQAGGSIAPWDGKERLTILLLGVDRREDEASR